MNKNYDKINSSACYTQLDVQSLSDLKWKCKQTSQMSVQELSLLAEYKLSIYEQQIFNQEFGLCSYCNQSKTSSDWCKNCNSKRFQQDFNKWTSGNIHINDFIQTSQLKARNKIEFLEWIPYNHLRNIQHLTNGGFSTIYEAIWLVGGIEKWDSENRQWRRYSFTLGENDYENAKIPK